MLGLTRSDQADWRGEGIPRGIILSSRHDGGPFFMLSMVRHKIDRMGQIGLWIVFQWSFEQLGRSVRLQTSQ